MTAWIANRNTATKLLGGFGLVLTLFAFTGLFAVQRLSRVQATSVEISDSWLPSVQLLGEIHTGMWNHRSKELRHMLLADVEKMPAVERMMDSLQALVAEKGKAYEPLITSDAERAAWNEASRAWQDYLTEHQRVRALSRQLRTEEAQRLAMGTSLTRVNDASKALAKGVDLNSRGAADARAAAAATYTGARVWILGVLTAAIALGLGIGIVLARLISRPLAEGVRVLERVAEGDMTVRLAVDTQDEVGQLAASLNRALDSLQRALVAVHDSAGSTASASQQLTAAALEISSGAQEQASSLEETAASLEEMTATVKQNADNAQQAQQLAAGAREVADKGGRVVGDAVGAMREINASSKKIADIITTIDEIAFQTNLLALNAAVEAARAGAQGRGFAVVAGEVRTLAQRSATAAKEIKGLIQDSVRKVEHGTSMVTASGQTLEEIVSSVKRVSDIVAEIAAASKEQATGIDQVNKAVTQMDAVTQSNAGQTEELSGTAESMSQQAHELQQLVSRFQLGNVEQAARRTPPRTAAKPAAKAAAKPAVRRPAVAPVRPTPRAGTANGNGSGMHHGNGNGNGHAPAPLGGRLATLEPGHDAPPSLPDLDEGFEEY